MLKIHIPEREIWNTKEEIFETCKGYDVILEHSLISVSKWEAKWHKAYLGPQEKTKEEILDYIRCMIVTPNLPDNIINFLTEDNLKEITSYMQNPMTATVFNDNFDNKPQAPSKDTMTSEYIYFLLSSYRIPFHDVEKWHLNRLMTLIRICSIKNEPTKKANPQHLAISRASLNAARRARTGSKG